MSTRSYDDEVVPVERTRPAEAVGGFLAAAAIAISVVAVVYRPVRLVPFALVIAFVAVGLTRERHARLAAAAVAVAALGFVAGMTVAVLTGRPLY
jgi:cell division inhibitor SulA